MYSLNLPIAANCPIKDHRAGRRTAEMPKPELSNKESPNEHHQATTGARSLVEIGVLRFSKEEVGSMENSLLLAKVRLNGRETRGLILLILVLRTILFLNNGQGRLAFRGRPLGES